MMRVKKSVYSVGILIVLSLLTLSGCGALGQWALKTVMPAAAQSQSADVEAPAASAQAPTAPVPDSGVLSQGTVLDDLQATLNSIYERVNPSVVSIQVTQKVSMPQMPFYGFTPQTEEQYQQSAGSGFVWDKQGYIVTNNHVVADADKINVQFYDGTIVQAELVGTDADSDLAVLKVDVPAGQLHPVTLADSTQVRVGQLAVAIGNPFGLENTMTVGFISAIGRSLPVNSESTSGARYTIPDIIQTDAPINPGNSGGVLVNEKGEVIGVPSAIISPVGASAGIGFAIPSATVAKVVPVLIEEGKYTHAWLGISGMTLTPDIAQAMGLDKNQRGALVISVQEDSPARKAGLRGSDGQITVDGQTLPTGGDVIIALAGNRINTFDDLVAALARFSAGDTVTLTVIRDGKTHDLKVTLGARPTQNTEIVPATPEQDESQDRPLRGQTAWLGIKGMTLDARIAKAMDLQADQQGVLVLEVVADSPAEKAGLRGGEEQTTINGQQVAIGGDVIIAWNDEPVVAMPQLQMFVGRAQPGDKVTLTILRDGKQMDLTVTLGNKP
ncbi:MAG TPA: trypsin-like peptidase domain-containing protein [Anaerolineae bacterium]|nr:trypsin-like peptidase domain-containing protein [Anaerolineae bacterium]HQK14439.1 trypsin-like peptidase domain-containing protein [Anaerolineae bacterium]